jgi:hypothetical protein
VVAIGPAGNPADGREFAYFGLQAKGQTTFVPSGALFHYPGMFMFAVSSGWNPIRSPGGSGRR